MKPLNAIAIGIFGVIGGYFVALALLFCLAFVFQFFDINDYGLLNEPIGLMAFIIAVTLLCGPLSVYLCIKAPRWVRWWLNRANNRHRLCATCGYDLFGSRLTRCPECGKPVPIEQRRRLAQTESPDA